MERNRLLLALVAVSVAFAMVVTPVVPAPLGEENSVTVWNYVPTRGVRNRDSAVENVKILLKACQSYIQALEKKELRQLTDEALQDPTKLLDSGLMHHAPQRKQLDSDIKEMVKSMGETLLTASQKVIATHLISELCNLALSIIYGAINKKLPGLSQIYHGYGDPAYYRQMKDKIDELKEIQPAVELLQLQWSNFPSLAGGPFAPKSGDETFNDLEDKLDLSDWVMHGIPSSGPPTPTHDPPTPPLHPLYHGNHDQFEGPQLVRPPPVPGPWNDPWVRRFSNPF